MGVPGCGCGIKTPLPAEARRGKLVTGKTVDLSYPNMAMGTPTRIINTSTTSRTAFTVSSGCSSAGEGYGIRNHLLREKLAPRIGSDNAVVREAVLALEKDDAILGVVAENTVHGKPAAVTTVEDGLQRLDLIAPRA